MKQLQKENLQLKQLAAAELTLDKAMLQDVLSKKMVKPSPRRVVEGFGSPRKPSSKA